MSTNLMGLINASVTIIESDSSQLRAAVVGWADNAPCIDVLCLVRAGQRAGCVVRAPLSAIVVDIAGTGLVG